MWNMIPTQMPCRLSGQEDEKIVVKVEVVFEILNGTVKPRINVHPYSLSKDIKAGELILELVRKSFIQPTDKNQNAIDIDATTDSTNKGEASSIVEERKGTTPLLRDSGGTAGEASITI